MPARKKAKAPPRKAAKGAPAKGGAKKPPARRPPGSPSVERIRVVVPLDFYEAHKDEVKAPIKATAMKWTFLGEGKGLYKREDGGVHAFTQFKDDGVHYSVWGSDAKARDKLLASWRKLLGETAWARATERGEEAVAAEKAQVESEAMRLWKLAQPQPRPGEPDLFFQKRVAEWEAKRPA